MQDRANPYSTSYINEVEILKKKDTFEPLKDDNDIELRQH